MEWTDLDEQTLTYLESVSGVQTEFKWLTRKLREARKEILRRQGFESEIARQQMLDELERVLNKWKS